MKYMYPVLLIGLIVSLTGCASTRTEVSTNSAVAPSEQQTRLALMTQAAENGDVAAQFELGKALETGTGIERNVEQAAGWYRRAVAQGHVPAMFFLGAMHGRGEGVERDYPEAVRLYRQAADAGYRDAIYPVAYAFENGIGVEKDLAEALKWYRKSADQGVHFAMERIAHAYALGELGLEVDSVQAEAWRARAKEAQGQQKSLQMAPIR